MVKENRYCYRVATISGNHGNVMEFFSVMEKSLKRFFFMKNHGKLMELFLFEYFFVVSYT